MASVRAVNYVLQRRYLIVPSTSYYFYTTPSVKINAQYSTKKSVTKVEPNDRNKVQVGFAEVVKENAKSAGYLAVVVTGVGLTALMLYVVFNELFSSKSPYAIYDKARDRCIEHPKIVDLLGAPIRAYGEETRRGRRNHVSHMYYIKRGIKYMKLVFYIQGTRRRGTVYVEMKENSSGNYEYSYLYVTVDHIGTVVIEDNRDNTKINQQDQSILDFN